MAEGPAELRAAYNELVQAVRQLRKLSVAAPLGLRWIGGSPALYWAGPTQAAQCRIGVLEEACPPDETAELRVWKITDDEPTATEEILTVRNWFLDEVAAGSRAIVGRGPGTEWTILAESACGPEVRSLRAPLAEIAGWDAEVEQVLGHDDEGRLKWFDVDECE